MLCPLPLELLPASVGPKPKTLWLSPWLCVPEHCRELGIAFCFLIPSSVVWNHCCFSSPLWSAGIELEPQWLKLFSGFLSSCLAEAQERPLNGWSVCLVAPGSAPPLSLAKSKVGLRRGLGAGEALLGNASGESLIPHFWCQLAWGFSWLRKSLEARFGRTGRHPIIVLNPGTN